MAMATTPQPTPMPIHMTGTPPELESESAPTDPLPPPPPPAAPLPLQPVGTHDCETAGWTPHRLSVVFEPSEPVQAVVPLCARVTHEHAPQATLLHA